MLVTTVREEVVYLLLVSFSGFIFDCAVLLVTIYLAQ